MQQAQFPHTSQRTVTAWREVSSYISFQSGSENVRQRLKFPLKDRLAVFAVI